MGVKLYNQIFISKIGPFFIDCLSPFSVSSAGVQSRYKKNDYKQLEIRPYQVKLQFSKNLFKINFISFHHYKYAEKKVFFV